MLEVQLGIGLPSSNNPPNLLYAAHQTAARAGNSNQAKKMLIVITYMLGNILSKLMELVILKILLMFNLFDYLKQYRVPKVIYDEYVGWPIVNPPLSCLDMNNFYATQGKDSKFKSIIYTPRKFNQLKSIDTFLITLD